MGSPGVVEGTQTMKILLAGAFWPWLLQPPRPHLRPLPLPRLMLIPGMGTTAMASTDLMAMDTTERGLLMLSPLLRLLLPLRLMLMPGTDTMATVCTDLMAMDTTDTGPMVMDTGERSKKHDSCQTAAN